MGRVGGKIIAFNIVGAAAGAATLLGALFFLVSVICLAMVSQPPTVWVPAIVMCGCIIVLPVLIIIVIQVRFLFYSHIKLHVLPKDFRASFSTTWVPRPLSFTFCQFCLILFYRCCDADSLHLLFHREDVADAMVYEPVARKHTLNGRTCLMSHASSDGWPRHTLHADL